MTGYIPITRDGLAGAATPEPDRVRGLGMGLHARRPLRSNGAGEGSRRRPSAQNVQPRRTGGRGRSRGAIDPSAGVRRARLGLVLRRQPQRRAEVRLRPQQRVQQRLLARDGGERLLLHDHFEHLPVDDHPGELGHRGRGGPELDHLEQRLHRHLSHSAGSRVLQRPARDLGRRGRQLQQHEDEPTALFAFQHLEHRDAESHHRGRQSQQADRR